MQIERIVVGPFEANCWLLRDSGAALVVDPGADAARIEQSLAGRGLTVAAYLLTHGHVDHVSALGELHARRPAPVFLHAADAAWAFGPRNALPPFYPAPAGPQQIDRLLAGDDTGEAAGIRWSAIATPGHTAGSVCYLFPDHQALFTGDTLFAGSVGRTDLPGGDSRELSCSLQRLTRLDGRLTVYPGHGPETNLDREKKHNYFMQSPRV